MGKISSKGDGFDGGIVIGMVGVAKEGYYHVGGSRGAHVESSMCHSRYF